MHPENGQNAAQDGLFTRILERRTPFFLVFFAVFVLTYGFLVLIDFVPEAPEEDVPSATYADAEQRERDATPQLQAGNDPYPSRIFIDALDREVAVLNPASRALADLDAALLEGVVRHPDSANLVDGGNVFLFGHSSSLPQVRNRNFQAFNGIQTLSWGDTIRVRSGDAEYTYRVTRVYQVRASEAEIMLDHSSSKLTLVTCNSFGSKDDRFVVEAELSDVRTL